MVLYERRMMNVDVNKSTDASGSPCVKALKTCNSTRKQHALTILSWRSEGGGCLSVAITPTMNMFWSQHKAVLI